MRIDDKNLSSVDTAGLRRTQEADRTELASQKTVGGRAGVPGHGDEIQLSSLAEKVQSLEPDSAASRARLEELTKLVASGKYTPDSEVVADRLIGDALDSKAPGGPV